MGNEQHIDWISRSAFSVTRDANDKTRMEDSAFSLDELEETLAWEEQGTFTLPSGWSGDGIVQFERNDEGPYVLLLRQHAPGFDYEFTKGSPNGPMPVRIHEGLDDREMTISLTTWPARSQNPFMGSVPFVMVPKFDFRGNREEGIVYVFERIKTVDPRPGRKFIQLAVATIKFSFSR